VHFAFWKNLLELLPVFLSGSDLYLYRDNVPDKGWIALASTVAFASGFVIPIGVGLPAYTMTSVDVTALFLAYPLIWLGIHLPLHRIGSRNDYSYGIYIYAFPIQQLLAI